MANASFWLGTAEAAEFHGLNFSVYHLCGRGREVSTLKPEDLSVVRVNEDLHSYHVISTTLQRDKDGPLQELSLYPHRDSLQEDPYFGFIHFCQISGGEGQKLRHTVRVQYRLHEMACQVCISKDGVRAT